MTRNPPDYLLVTFLVTRDGEQGHPMDSIAKRVDLTADGQPVAIGRLTDAIVQEISRKARSAKGAGRADPA